MSANGRDNGGRHGRPEMPTGPEDQRDETSPPTPREGEPITVELGALKQHHRTLLEIESYVATAVRHAAQAERVADRAYALQIDHGHALDRMARAIAEQKGDIAALATSLQNHGTHVDGTFAGIARLLEHAQVGNLGARFDALGTRFEALAGVVASLQMAIGRVPDDTKPADEGVGLLGWMGSARRRWTQIVTIVAVLSAGGGAGLLWMLQRLIGGGH